MSVCRWFLTGPNEKNTISISLVSLDIKKISTHLLNVLKNICLIRSIITVWKFYFHFWISFGGLFYNHFHEESFWLLNYINYVRETTQSSVHNKPEASAVGRGASINTPSCFSVTRLYRERLAVQQTSRYPQWAKPLTLVSYPELVLRKWLTCIKVQKTLYNSLWQSFFPSSPSLYSSFPPSPWNNKTSYWCLWVSLMKPLLSDHWSLTFA